MWLIPGKTKIRLEIFRGVGIPDILLGLFGASVILLLLLSTLPFRAVSALLLLVIFVSLLLRVDGKPNYLLLLSILRHLGSPKRFSREEGVRGAERMEKIIPFTAIRNRRIEYGGQYYGAVLEISPVEFRLFSEHRKQATITNGVGKVLRSASTLHSVDLVKLERPVHYEENLQSEYRKLQELRLSYENGMLTEEELMARYDIVYDRIRELEVLCGEEKVVVPFYYMVLFDSDPRKLEAQAERAIEDLQNGEIPARRLEDRELAIFLRYTNGCDVREEEIAENGRTPEELAEWASPENVRMKVRTTEVDGVLTHTLHVNGYPKMADDAWLATVLTMPATKVVVKCRALDLSKAIRNIDRSLSELRAQYSATGVESRQIELEQHITSLNELLQTLQGDNEVLLQTNIYVTAYDRAASEKAGLPVPEDSLLPRIANMKRSVKRLYSENGLKLSSMDFEEVRSFVASQISDYDPFFEEGQGIPGNSLAASYPWVFANVSDEGGIRLGRTEGVPVFIDFFQRNSERVNSNMMIVGKSGSGKSFATKSILANLAADNAKIFILDPENEYAELSENLHGRYINVGNALQGRLNPFQIITSLEDEEGGRITGSYAVHLQFLEEFFRQILPDCDRDSLEYLNSIVDRMYMEKGITESTDLRKLHPSDYPVFDDLYDAILREFQQTDSDYIRTILRNLMNYVQKFSAGGRNAAIWNGPSTIRTDENFTVFNFQSLLSNRNGTVANAQMLLVLKYIDNEIIKNREYNRRNHTSRKIVVVIDEAHVFIDSKYPAALDFMYQLAKRIRKYNGMLVVITQNIRDFTGSEEIARKSGAIVNACQYSLIFALAPNDMEDLCRLYEKAGGINETEQENISSAARGQAFAVLGPAKRTGFRVETGDSIRAMFEEPGFVSRRFGTEEGLAEWEEMIGPSRRIHESNSFLLSDEEIAGIDDEEEGREKIFFEELTEEEEQERIQIAEDLKSMTEEKSQEKRILEKAAEEAAEAPEAPAAREPLGSGVSSDEVLLRILNSLSSENMEMKIRRAVNDEVERVVSERLRTILEQGKGTAASEVSGEASKKELREENEYRESSFYTEDTDPDRDLTEEDYFTGYGYREEQSGFDLEELFRREKEIMETDSFLERMEEAGAEVMEITPEELLKYMKSLKPKE